MWEDWLSVAFLFGYNAAGLNLCHVAHTAIIITFDKLTSQGYPLVYLLGYTPEINPQGR